MEATGAVKDAPVIRECSMRRCQRASGKRLGLPIRKSPGQEISETLHSLETLLLKLISREELVFSRQSIGLTSASSSDRESIIRSSLFAKYFYD
jgi:hypothetical protein